jgi:hypothetical protein
MIKVYLDFEYNRTQEKTLNLVCLSILTQGHDWPHDGKTQNIWLHDDNSGKKIATRLIQDLRDKDAVFVSFAATAEGRAVASLGINPIKMKWIDLHLEYKMLTNHCNKIAYGRQLIRGKETFTKPPKPKWNRTEDDQEEINASKAETNLAAACFKLLKVKIDTDHKKEMRDLIISDPEHFSDEQMEAIMEYCAGDVEHLPALLKKVVALYREMYQPDDLKKVLPEMLLRGEYAARTAVMERLGYPVNVKAVKTFVAKVPDIMREMCEDINSQFQKRKPFRWNNKAQRYSMDLGTIREWINLTQDVRRWQKTDTGMLSVSSEAFEDRFHYRHDYPRGNFGAQLLRYFKFRKSLNGFLPKSPDAKNKETFLDYVGSDGFCRPYMNIYGAQSGRSQPKATSFIPLKAAWMRSLIQPPKGYFMAALDYSSEEFLLSSLVSQDINMVNAYKSGDPYLYFAIQAGAAPEGATKKTHGKIREPFKSTTLGLSYGMQEKSLAEKLTQDTGKEYTAEDARALIDQFFQVYGRYNEWLGENLQAYQEKGYIKLPCGWTMWGDNDNTRSINNVVIQGLGSSVMRKAVALSQDRGVAITFTLHDALYMIGKCGQDEHKIDVMWGAMSEAFSFYFKGRAKAHAESIRIDGKLWGPTIKEGEYVTPQGKKLKAQKIHVDERALTEYQQFNKYFI